MMEPKPPPSPPGAATALRGGVLAAGTSVCSIEADCYCRRRRHLDVGGELRAADDSLSSKDAGAPEVEERQRGERQVGQAAESAWLRPTRSAERPTRPVRRREEAKLKEEQDSHREGRGSSAMAPENPASAAVESLQPKASPSPDPEHGDDREVRTAGRWGPSTCVSARLWRRPGRARPSAAPRDGAGDAGCCHRDQLAVHAVVPLPARRVRLRVRGQDHRRGGVAVAAALPRAR